MPPLDFAQVIGHQATAIRSPYSPPPYPFRPPPRTAANQRRLLVGIPPPLRTSRSNPALPRRSAPSYFSQSFPQDLQLLPDLVSPFIPKQIDDLDVTWKIPTPGASSAAFLASLWKRISTKTTLPSYPRHAKDRRTFSFAQIPPEHRRSKPPARHAGNSSPET
jgi:hypothetical protein